jgi:protein TonB
LDAPPRDAPKQADAPSETAPEPSGDLLAERFDEPTTARMPDGSLLASTREAMAELLTGVEPTFELPSAASPPPLASDLNAADIFASRGAELAALSERIGQRNREQSGRARRKAISTRTKEYRYASYMEAWRRKVERIGNLNYPPEARDLGLFGSLILHVAVRADGSLEGIRVVRSSGHDVLDDAAVRIVELSAPFAPFPDDIAADTDVLDITRVWQFQRNNRLGWDG